MYYEIPQYGLRAYALFFSKFGSVAPFSQSELDFAVSQPMKKKIFSLLLRAGWIKKYTKNSYLCQKPNEIFLHLLDFKVPSIMREAKKPYCFCGLSAVEIWSDYAYIQRGRERSPYFIKVLRKDLGFWKEFFNLHGMPNYEGRGTSIGEFVILIPVKRINGVEKEGLWVEPLKETMKQAGKNEMFSYAYDYMGKKYGKIQAA
ncbi:hypothetical protein COV61_01710 [Candidatus Micrarchaeota archaeon CG11_big_fil_rev_8_21_14_0_20_47_5]|nr:MAG: hypothetical protein AUJ17_03115 [Candidatus Micrarchaeota archaeon CG1_02_47_40]PIN83909.1 MAG: hypothetical protein COV61_01710 [Candidatus Micrarchaeota archaeon CG11_big_fil_rev_8_21_14_0_20_47_5]